MTKKERIIVPIVGAALLLVFTFTDLPISMALYTKNLFGRIFEVVGELPFAFFATFAFVLLFRFHGLLPFSDDRAWPPAVGKPWLSDEIEQTFGVG